MWTLEKYLEHVEALPQTVENKERAELIKRLIERRGKR